MSGALLHIAVDDLAVEPLGVKEAVVMALEHLGGVRVLEIQLQEPEQTRMAGDAFAPSKPRPRPGPKPSPPPPSGQAPVRGSRRPQTAMECCFNCARYRSDQNRDADGNPYWGVCGRTGEPVYEIGKRCPAWARLGG